MRLAGEECVDDIIRKRRVVQIICGAERQDFMGEMRIELSGNNQNRSVLLSLTRAFQHVPALECRATLIDNHERHDRELQNSQSRLGGGCRDWCEAKFLK